ncbi:MAG: T9SS type A sorting domain-containing protein [Ignavibacteria bacterium]
MKYNILLLTLLFCISSLFAQELSSPGNYYQSQFTNGAFTSRFITVPEIYKGERKCFPVYKEMQGLYPSSSYIRWVFNEPTGICMSLEMSADGLVPFVGWGLNNKRVSLYNNNNSTPLWEYFTSAQGYQNWVAVSDTGNVLAAGSYHNILLFNKNSNVPFFNFDLTSTPDTGVAGPIDVTSDGNFIVASANRNDSSYVYGFNKNSIIPAWKFRMPGIIYGIRISGNDSLVIISTYTTFKVVNTFTGAVRYAGTISGGNQQTFGISGNGNIITTSNLQGYLYVYQWNGSTYTLLWQFQEPPGTYYNWITAEDVSYDGQYIAVGTLNFLSSSSYDGKVRYFKVSNGSTPLWTYAGIGDEVQSVNISKNGKIVVAASWGSLTTPKEDILFFRGNPGNGVPIFGINTPGSAFVCSISADGTSAIAGGKAVHARTMGYGGTLYNVYVDTSQGPSSIHQHSTTTPVSYSLRQNYPNPFNPATNIEFEIPRTDFVSLKIYDINGREVETLVNEVLSAGVYRVTFEARNCNSGIYFYKLTGITFSQTKKMILIK